MRTGRIPHRRVRVFGHEFDSKAEAGRYLELYQKQKDGEISDLRLQPEFELIPPARVPHEKALRGHKYKADFQYLQNGETVVEDVKSAYTRKDREYILNRKMMWYLKKIYVREVVR